MKTIAMSPSFPRRTRQCRMGGFMRRILVALIVACLLSATSAAPVFADGWGGHPHGRGGGFNPLWPITTVVTAALYIPAAIIGSVAQLAVPGPLGYGYAPPPAPVGRVYSGSPTYYAPGYSYAPTTNYAPRPYYQQRVYVAPSESYTPPYYIKR